MCGIAGILDTSSVEPKINISILKKMSDVIRHRGPDSEGQWISTDNKCGLTFRRLAIIDLSPAGNQPMTTSDGRYTLIFNGEIYNHLEIKKELIEKGYNYNSKTDSETILYGFKEYGEKILDKMHGMWGLAIWDDENKELFIARDRIGIKPMYYTYNSGIFIFASEIKSIIEHPSITVELNFEQLPNYLNFGMSGNKDTLFKNIHKLPAGHFLRINLKGEIKIERYWSPLKHNQQYSSLNINEVHSEILRLFRQSVNARMMSDVPFGVFLSGGIDSSLNVAVMHEFMDRPIDTYSVGFKELEKYNELEYARKVARLYNTNHNEVLIDSKDCFDVLDKIVWHTDEPNADPVCMPLYFLSKLTRDSGTIVIQVGEGSDEQFVGYPWMLREYLFHNSYWRIYKNLPKILKKTTLSTAKIFLKSFHRYEVLEYFRRATMYESQYWSGMPIFSPSFQEDLFLNGYNDLTQVPAKYGMELNNTALAFNSNADFLQLIEFAELQNRLAEILLMRVDKITMAHSIEARVPFLDHRLVEFTMSLPPQIKAPDRKSTKILLKKAVESVLPKDIIYRKKQGFWAPVNEWLRGEWYEFSKSVILESYFIKEKIFDDEFIKMIIGLHKSNKRNYGLHIYTLLTLSLWFKRYFHNK